MAEFTPTQGRYLSFIHEYTEGFGLPPAESEIAAALGVSPPSVNQMVKTLERKGLIRREPGVPRSIEILVPPEAIPRWKGKRIIRTVREWTLMQPAQPRAPTRGKPPARRGRAARHAAAETRAGKAVVYRFKITLQGIAPPIWRRIETKDVTLAKLHELIQTAMGWTNSHLHQFEIAGTLYADPQFQLDPLGDAGVVDYTGVRISELVAEYGTKLRMGYEYDFGDGWQHDVVLEKMTDAEPRVRYPRCIGGERACPPEDVGGVYGFADFVEAIMDPDHSEHEEMLEWSGPFDPLEFDAEEATRRMRRGLPRW